MRGPIGFDDPRWRSSVPHLVTPLEDEWLVGLVLRCDLANGWSAGTTGRRLRRSPTSLTILDKTLGAFATARTLDLSRLAELLAVPLASLQRTTFEAGLDRLRIPGQATPRRIVIARPFRVCPACIAAHRLIARGHILPLVDTCLEHGARLESVCPCGARLRPFHRAEPFTCPGCRAEWRELPRRRADAATLTLNARLLTFFRFFLERGEADSIANTLRVIAAEMARRGLRRLPPIPREAAVPTNIWDQASVSLTRVVGALAALEMAPEAVLRSGLARFPADRVPCLNRACPRFGLAGLGNVHPFRRRANVEIYYCLECGTHFSRDRIVSSFDDDCRSGRVPPSPCVVAEQQMRLATWRAALETACMQLLAEDLPISIANAFRRAAIPRTPSLRATRLGLVAIVEQYATLQADGVRARILAGGGDGMTPGQLGRTVGVSISLVRQVLARRPKRRAGRPRRIKVEQDNALWAQLEANPAATAAVHAQQWDKAQGTTMQPSTMRAAIYRLGWTRIKGRWEPPSTPRAT